MIRLLAWIWEASGYLCGVRLKAALPYWLPWATQRTEITPTMESQLQRRGPRQVDRRPLI